MNSEAEQTLLERALRVLEEKTGLSATVLARNVPDPKSRTHLDAQIALRAPNGSEYEYLVEIKLRTDREATLAHVKHQLGTYGADPTASLLITSHLTPTMLDLCRTKLDLQTVDASGNAYLKRPGLYVYNRGERPDPSLARESVATAGTATWLRVVCVLLSRPDLLGATYREIARAARVALGTVGPVLQDLELRRLLRTVKNERRILEPERLLQEWVAGYPTRLRPKLHPLRLRARDEDWWRSVRLPVGAQWGGDVAAERLTNYLKPVDVTVYVEPTARRSLLAELVRSGGLRADAAGSVEVLDLPVAASPDQQPTDVVHPLISYADLLSTVDPRHHEVAQMIRERYLNDVLGR